MGFKLKPSTRRLWAGQFTFLAALGTLALSGGTVYAVTMTEKGHGYISASDASVTITAAPSGGTNATATAILGEGIVTYVPVTTAGAGYITPPAVTFTGGGGSGALGVGIIGPNGSIVGVRLTNVGSGYTSVPTAAIAAAPTGGTNAVMGTVQCAFKITGITITNAGAGYVSVPTITFGQPLQSVTFSPAKECFAIHGPWPRDPRAIATETQLTLLVPLPDPSGVLLVPASGTGPNVFVVERLKLAGNYNDALAFELDFEGY